MKPDYQSPIGRFRRALGLRSELRASYPETDAWRLLDGDGDGLPGIVLESYAGWWLAQTRDPVLPRWLVERGPEAAAYSGWPCHGLYHKRLDIASKEPPEHIAGERVPGRFEVKEAGLRLLIDFASGYSQGLFLDQRDNRAIVRRMAGGREVLNTFAYTCAFGVAAAAGGGRTTNVDLSRASLDWGRANYAANGLDPEGHEFLKGDVFSWLRRLEKRGRRFGLILLDPPTFSRDERGRVFRVEEDLGRLLALAVALLEPAAAIMVSTNCRAMSAARFRGVLRDGLGGRSAPRALKMPADFTGDPYLKAALAGRGAGEAVTEGRLQSPDGG